MKISDRLHAVPSRTTCLHHYPAEIRKEVKGISIPSSPNEDWIDHLPTTGWSPGNGCEIKNWPIPLATYSSSLQDLDWFKDEPDEENSFALHRFIWLLRWLSQVPSRADLLSADRTILDWIEKVGPARNSLAWRTYSVSERVVNWLVFLCATKNHRNLDSKMAGTIGASLFEHLKHIMTHLEYYGKSYNNHILNNARALYVGGRFLHLPQVAHLGKILFQKCIPRLVDEEGSLLEGSTHYQLLLTRTLVEVLWAAKASGDSDFALWAEKEASSMISCCLYLGGTSLDNTVDSFPCIGDISPDYPVSWFYPHPDYRQEPESWQKLWDATTVSSLLKEKAGQKKLIGGLKQWKWVRTSRGTLRALIHTPQLLGLYPAAHGHLDFGGFLLNDAEGPVLVDRGRISYHPDAYGIYGFSARAHNTTLINGFPIIPDCRGIFSGYSEYLSHGSEVGIYDRGFDKIISWRTNALERFGKDIKWCRDLVIKRDQIESLETILNPRGVAINSESYIHWAPGWTIVNNMENDSDDFLIGKTGRVYRLKIEMMLGEDGAVEFYEGTPNSLEGWQIPDYGARVPALTMRMSVRSTHDYSVRFLLCPV
ncbi:MAG: heparinase II/III family protein [Pseudomonadota bacterium]